MVQTLARALHELGVPHPLHIHASNLGVPGNIGSTLATITATEVGKLAPEAPGTGPGYAGDPDNFGCGFLDDHRIVTTAIGNTLPGEPANGQLFIWFGDPEEGFTTGFTSVTDGGVTFQVLVGLGLSLGSVGLGIVVLRNVLERRGELAVLMAVGFRKPTLQRLLLIENGALLTTLDVGTDYEPGSALDVGNGVSVQFGPGTLSAGDSFETLLIAKRYGLDAQRMREVLLQCPGANGTLQRWDTTRFTWQEKDMDLTLALAQKAGLMLPLAGQVDQLIKTLTAADVKALLYGPEAAYLGRVVKPLSSEEGGLA